MKILKTKFKDLKIIKTDIFKDNRGFFKEISKKKILKKYNFIFDCMSVSKKNVLRGLHFQENNPQAKFITVTKGKIFDVVVDLRKKSKTYGKYFSIIISQESDFSILIPGGFAHGFYCMSKECVVYYKCTNYQNKKSEKTLSWNDPSIGIKWPCTKPILSKKDNLGFKLKA
jgi:dTDP-4-dehydrorhamnose 3,5-epimerase